MTDNVKFNTLQKIKTFEDWINEDHVLVHFDSRGAGVSIPSHLTDNPALTLKLSYLFQGETTYDNDRISSYLKFSGEYFQCLIPWDTVWGMTSCKDMNKIWPEDLPRELVFQFAKAKVKELGGNLFGNKKNKNAKDGEEQQAKANVDLKPKPTLAAVSTKAEHKTESQDKEAPPKKTNHLIRIK